tara:strand:+ start:91 stop:600 length:510 start_codon:yes stop_codon:yes gene_type:complete
VKKKELVHIGTFLKPLGLKGEINIKMLTSTFISFKSLNSYINKNNGSFWEFEYLKINKKGKLIGLLFDCNNRTCAEKLYGNKIFTFLENLSEKEKNHLNLSDLIGYQIINSDNKLIGILKSIDNFGASDLLNVKNIKKSFYIPMNEENVVKINKKNKTIIVNPLKGIID